MSMLVASGVPAGCLALYLGAERHASRGTDLLTSIEQAFVNARSRQSVRGSAARAQQTMPVELWLSPAPAKANVGVGH